MKKHMPARWGGAHYQSAAGFCEGLLEQSYSLTLALHTAVFIAELNSFNKGHTTWAGENNYYLAFRKSLPTPVLDSTSSTKFSLYYASNFSQLSADLETNYSGTLFPNYFLRVLQSVDWLFKWVPLLNKFWKQWDLKVYRLLYFFSAWLFRTLTLYMNKDYWERVICSRDHIIGLAF